MSGSAIDSLEMLDAEYWDEEEGGVGGHLVAVPQVYLWAPSEESLGRSLLSLMHTLLQGAQSEEQALFLDTLWGRTEEGEWAVRWEGADLVAILPAEDDLYPFMRALFSHAWLMAGLPGSPPSMGMLFGSSKTND